MPKSSLLTLKSAKTRFWRPKPSKTPPKPPHYACFCILMGNIVGIRCKSCGTWFWRPRNRRNGCLDPKTASKTVETAVWTLKRPPKPSKRLFGPPNGLQNRRNGCLDPQTASKTRFFRFFSLFQESLIWPMLFRPFSKFYTVFHGPLIWPMLFRPFFRKKGQIYMGFFKGP